MRKLISTAVVLGLSGLLIGCPGKTDAKSGSKKTGSAAKSGSAAKTGDDAKTDAAEDAKTDAAEDAKTEEAPAAAKGVDISHVKVGQIYKYEGESSGMKMEQHYKVLEITDGKIKYEMTNIMHIAGMDKPNESKSEAEWVIPASTGEPAKADPNAPKMEEGTISLGGKDWDCYITDDGKGSKTWTPRANGMPTFPSFLKMDTPQMKMELKSIDG